MLSNILRLKTADHSEEKVGWLELFYDLVYVATVIALGNKLSDDITTEGVLSFAVLFVPVWWSWTGMAFYITRFNIDDVGHRLLVFAQMFAVSVMAINIRDGLGDTSQAFAIAYAAARLLLVVMYFRAGQMWPAARPLATRYAQGFSLAAAIWLVSAAIPDPARFGLWAVALGVDFGTPLLPSTRQLQAQSPPSAHHLPERFGLLTIIVLGEAFIKVITEASDHDLHLELANALYGVCALIIAASLWWMYFDNVKGSVVRRTRFAGQVWVYAHLPLVASITAYGVAAKKVALIEPGYHLADEKRLLFAGAVAVALLMIAILDLSSTESASELTRNGLAMLRIGSSAVILVMGLLGDSMSVGALLSAIALICAAQVVVDIFQTSQDPAPTSEYQEEAH